MNILDSTYANHPLILEIFLKGIHDDDSGKESIEPSGAREIALKIFGDSLDCVFLYFYDYFLEKLIPLSFF